MGPHFRVKEGSPPRMRGKVCDLTIIRVHHGITPACAGKRHCPRSRPGRIRDHPRVCGEKPGGRLRELVYPGSPPRMRGKGLMDAELSNAVGITPACAGKSAAQSLDRLCAGDHPRVCGEKARTLIVQDEPQGSPPRVRGKEWYLQGESPAPGITPAYAGKRASSTKPTTLPGDHPRVCGEKGKQLVK